MKAHSSLLDQYMDPACPAFDNISVFDRPLTPTNKVTAFFSQQPAASHTPNTTIPLQ